MWYFEYFGYHYSTQKLSCQKLWHLSFQTPYRTCLHEARMCFCILIKIEDFCLISNEKVIFLQNSMEYQKIMNIDKYVTFDLGWLYTWLTRRWKASNLQFSKNFFWVPFGVPRLAVKSHLYALLIYFLFKNWNELDEFKDSMGTIVVPKKFVLQNLKSKPSNAISHM